MLIFQLIPTVLTKVECKIKNSVDFESDSTNHMKVSRIKIPERTQNQNEK